MRPAVIRSRSDLDSVEGWITLACSILSISAFLFSHSYCDLEILDQIKKRLGYYEMFNEGAMPYSCSRCLQGNPWAVSCAGAAVHAVTLQLQTCQVWSFILHLVACLPYSKHIQRLVRVKMFIATFQVYPWFCAEASCLRCLCTFCWSRHNGEAFDCGFFWLVKFAGVPVPTRRLARSFVQYWFLVALSGRHSGRDGSTCGDCSHRDECFGRAELLQETRRDSRWCKVVFNH